MEYNLYSVKITFVDVKNVYTHRSAGTHISHSPSSLSVLELVKCLPCIHTLSPVPFISNLRVAPFLSLMLSLIVPNLLVLNEKEALHI